MYHRLSKINYLTSRLIHHITPLRVSIMATTTTRSAIVSTYGSPPTLQTIPLPPPSPNEIQIKLLATGAHGVVRSRAAGTHFSSGLTPHSVGVDGVGSIVSLPSSPSTKTSNFKIGQTVYFGTFQTGGSFSEILNVPQQAVYAVPSGNGIDIVQLAALVNPAMSSWMALKTRTVGLKQGFTVVIMGATSASGSIAIELCRYLGAGKVIGVARSRDKLEGLGGLDRKIQLQQKDEETDYSELGEVDVILDYVYGKPMAHLLGQLKGTGEMQYVQIGGLSGSATMEVPSGVLRSKNLVMRGCAPGSWSFGQLGQELPGLLEAVGKLAKRKVKVLKLEEVEKTWGGGGGEGRAVYVQ